MSTEKDVGMDIQSGQVPTSNSEVWGRNSLFSINSSRDPSMASSGWATPYHDRMNTDMDYVPTIEETNSEHLELSYETEQEKGIRVGMAANQQEPMRPHNVNNEATPTHAPHKEDVINIQLLYDPQAPTEPELWSGSFHPISLHGSVEHFASDSKNIEVTFNFMTKYIQNKQVLNGKVNDLNNFNGMGDAIWNFISAVYVAKWDAFYTDQKANMLRVKILSKFALRIPPAKGNVNKEIPKSVLVTINKVPPLPPLPAKSKKEINVISKYFQAKKQLVENITHMSNGNPGKLYAQATKPLANTLEILKIKETFPSLNAQKIDQKTYHNPHERRECIVLHEEFIAEHDQH